MSDTNTAPGGAPASPATSPFAPNPEPQGVLSVREAVSELIRERNEEDKQPEPDRAAPEAAAEQEPERDQETEAAPAEEQTSDAPDQSEADPEPETPPIEPPRSWTKEEKEAFKALPPEHQQRIADRERAREVEIRRGQNEVAEKSKAMLAKEQALDQARQKYEDALPVLLQTLEAKSAGEFADVQSAEDVQRLARDEPLRYLQWDAHQKQLAAVHNQVSQANQRKAEEAQKAFRSFSEEQDKAFEEKHPEFKDPEKAPKARQQVVEYLHSHGITDEQIGKMWNGQMSVSIRHATFQSVLADAAKWRASQKAVAAAKAQPKPTPPVQRPGTAAAAKPVGDADVQQAQKRFDQTNSLRDAAALLAAQRRAKR